MKSKYLLTHVKQLWATTEYKPDLKSPTDTKGIKYKVRNNTNEKKCEKNVGRNTHAINILWRRLNPGSTYSV